MQTWQASFCLMVLLPCYISHPLLSLPSRQSRYPIDHYRHRRDVPISSYAAAFPESFSGTPVAATSSATINKASGEDDYNGTFNYSFDNENGISLRLSGRPKTLSSGEVVQTMEGQYSYTAPDGTPITTRWYADETGFHAEGEHIPGSPL